MMFIYYSLPSAWAAKSSSAAISPSCPPSRYFPALQILPDEARERILSGNARGLLG